MLDLIVYDGTFTAQGVVDTENSLIWERRFYEAGYFEIHAPATENNNALLKQGNYIMRADALESGYIQYLHKETAEDGTTDVCAIGRFLSYLLHGHIVRSSQTYSGNAETVMRNLVSGTVMTAGTDYIPNLHLGELCRTEKTVIINLEYPDLHDALKEIARQSGVGFRIILDPNTEQMYFECFDSHNYSAGQYDAPQVIFSPDYDTIIGSASYTEDDSTTVNVVTMRYAGDLGEAVVRYNPNNITGLAIREIVVTTNECKTYYDAYGGIHLDVSGTEDLLRGLAPQYLAEKYISVEAAAAHTGSFEYKEDYDIGDIVTIEYAPYDITLTQRIHKIVESYDESGKKIIPVTGPIWPKGEEI